MAATKSLHYNERFRARIKSSLLRKRLQDHALGAVEMSATQIRAAEILLKKCVPDLSATELTGKDGEALKPGILVVPYKDGQPQSALETDAETSGVPVQH
jgi:hypothetical protein